MRDFTLRDAILAEVLVLILIYIWVLLLRINLWLGIIYVVGFVCGSILTAVQYEAMIYRDQHNH